MSILSIPTVENVTKDWRDFFRMKTWYPTVSHVLDGSFGGENIEDTTPEKNRILATLKDFPQSLALVYSDEPNREAAAVVHWR